MKKFEVLADKNRFIVDTFLVTRASSSFEFFHSEFKSLPFDLNGNILMSYQKEDDSKKGLKNLLISIRECLAGNQDKSIGVPIGTEGYYYFNSEYSNLSRDAKQNIIVPEDIQVKRVR